MKSLVKKLASVRLSRRAESLLANPGRDPVARPVGAILDTMLGSGGDERLLVNPHTGRNRYGIPQGSAAGEIWFSSAVAAAASPLGLAAANHALDRTTRAADALSLPGLFADIRDRLACLFAPQGAEIALAGSGAEAEFILLAAASSILSNPLTSLLAAPEESGESFALAAEGRHFVESPPFGAQYSRGQKVEGFASDRRVVPIELRDRYGVPLDAGQVDRAVEKNVARAIGQGRDVLLHLVDCSQTGRSGPSRACAANSPPPIPAACWSQSTQGNCAARASRSPPISTPASWSC